MHIESLHLQNYRCFGPNKTTIRLEKLTTLIGINSSGKTAVLQALTKLFGNTPSQRAVERTDFHMPPGMRSHELPKQSLFIEAVIALPELENDSAMAQQTIPRLWNALTVDSPGKRPYVRLCVSATLTRGATLDGNIEQETYFLKEPDATPETGTKIPIQAIHRPAFNLEYVPAIRNPTSQIAGSASVLYRIFNAMEWPQDLRDNLRQHSSSLQELLGKIDIFSTLKQTLNTEWARLHSDARFTEILLQFAPEELEDTLRKLDVRFAPSATGEAYAVESLGEGLRSLFYFSIVGTQLQFDRQIMKIRSQQNTSARSAAPPPEAARPYRAQVGLETELSPPNVPTPAPVFPLNDDYIPPSLTILAVEEPESHLSPHVLGRVVDSLAEVARQENGQVILTSHTPAIVGRVDPTTIRHLRIPDDLTGTLVSEIELPEKTDEAYKYVKEAVKAYPELYFSKLVVLGEGDTEEIVLPRILTEPGTSLDKSSMSVVPLGGRHVNHFWRLLKQINVPYTTLLDLDYGREHGGWARIKYIVDQLLEKGVELEKLIAQLHAKGVEATPEDIDDLGKRRDPIEQMTPWLEMLEEDHFVFFAYPLDMDFMLLTAYESIYTQDPVVPRNGGPRIFRQAHVEFEAMEAAITSAVDQTLKHTSSDQNLYPPDDNKRMIWYAYHFLNRGKPTTHIQAWAELDQSTLLAQLPDPLKRLTTAAEKLLKAGGNSPAT